MTRNQNQNSGKIALEDFPCWKLEDAKALFSELVREARDRVVLQPFRWID